MCKADLDAAQGGGHADPVGWQVGQEAGHQGGRGEGGLQEAHEGVAVHWGHHLSTQPGERYSWVLVHHYTEVLSLLCSLLTQPQQPEIASVLQSGCLSSSGQAVSSLQS